MNYLLILVLFSGEVTFIEFHRPVRESYCKAVAKEILKENKGEVKHALCVKRDSET